MHKIKYLSVIFFSLFIISCKSAGLPLILGSEKQTIDKIHVEYMNIGDTYLSLQQYDKAIEYYNKAMKNKELYWNCYYKIGKVYALKNQWEEASVYFKKLLEREFFAIITKPAVSLSKRFTILHTKFLSFSSI